MTTYFYFHGFGVDETDRGLFSDISSALDGQHIFTAFNKTIGKDMYQSSIAAQVKMIKDRLDSFDFEDGVAIAHSQGCLAAALALVGTDYKIRQVILLAPPVTSGIGRFMNSFKDRPGTSMNPQGNSILERRDGTRTIISKECLQDMESNYKISRQAYAKIPYPANVIRAKEDEILREENGSDKLGLPVITIDNGSHNFTRSRSELIAAIKNILQQD